MINADARYYWSESYGRFELVIPGNAVLDIFQPGPADSAVEFWAARIERPVEATADLLRKSLSEYGAWDDAELVDDAANWERVVWLAACDLGDNPEQLDEVV